MIGFTAKLTKTRLAVIALLIVLIPFLMFSAVYILKGEKNDISSFSGATTEQRISFLKQFGWETDKTSETVKDTVIPAEFDNIYEAYNSIQLSQGFDLYVYRGQKVKLYNIKVNNYPKDSEYVYATLLVKDNVIIGGDIHSTELNGFMHGFELK